jgi:predicted methyltransferase
MLTFGHNREEFMKLRLVLLAATALVFAVPATAAEIPSYVTAAVSNPDRTAEETARDANRKPDDMVTFAGIKPGNKVVDLVPGKDQYFTHIFANVVGKDGHVYSFMPTEFDAELASNKPPIQLPPDGTVNPAWGNVTFLHRPLVTLNLPEKVDVVWTSQNYHDFHDKFMGPVDIAAYNKAVYAALKPGGTYIVLDHAAPGTGLSATETLHRIDPAVVKQEVTAAGFVFAGEDDSLANPADDHSKLVFDPSIRGKTDQFVYKFNKPE